MKSAKVTRIICGPSMQEQAKAILRLVESRIEKKPKSRGRNAEVEYQIAQGMGIRAMFQETQKALEEAETKAAKETESPDSHKETKSPEHEIA